MRKQKGNSRKNQGFNRENRASHSHRMDMPFLPIPKKCIFSWPSPSSHRNATNQPRPFDYVPLIKLICCETKNPIPPPALRTWSLDSADNQDNVNHNPANLQIPSERERCFPPLFLICCKLVVGHTRLISPKTI